MGAMEMLAYAVAAKLRKGVEFREACNQVFADEGITDSQVQAELKSNFGSILGNIAAERRRQRGFRFFKKPPKVEVNPQTAKREAAKPITKEMQLMFASVTAFMKAGVIYKKNSDTLDGPSFADPKRPWQHKKAN